jgi:hypothetical protein
MLNKIRWDAIPALRLDSSDNCLSVQDWWSDNTNDKVQSSVIIAFLWSIVKSRHMMFFQNNDEKVHVILLRAANAIKL